MIRNTLDQLHTMQEQAERSSIELAASLADVSPQNGEPLTGDTLVPGAFGSVDDVINRVNIAVGLLKSTKSQSENDYAALPKTLLTNLLDRSSKLTEETQNIAKGVSEYIKTIGIREIKFPEIIFIRNDNGEQGYNLGAKLKNLDDFVDQVLHFLNQINIITEPESYDAFSGAIKSAKFMQTQATKLKQEIANLKKAAKNQATQITKLNDEVENSSSSIKTVSEQSISLVGEISSNKDQSSNLKDEIQSTKASADQLQAQIDAYQEKFTTFQTDLNKRNETFEEYSQKIKDLLETEGTKLSTLIQQSEAAEKKLTAIQQKSEHALGHATAAGLASHFRQAGSRLKWPIRVSQVVFYISIMLILTSILVVFNALPWIKEIIALPPLTPPTESTAAAALLYIFGSVLARFIIILPGLWLASFSSRWHRSLLGLREEYAHKESIAASVPGFKEEAGENYEASIAALAFEAILSNPNGAHSPNTGNNPKGGILTKPIRTALREVLEEMGKPKGDV